MFMITESYIDSEISSLNDLVFYFAVPDSLRQEDE